MAQSSITISRRLYTGLWVAIVILVLICIVCLLKSGNRVKTSALDDAIANVKAPTIALIGEDIVPEFFSADGAPLESCGTLGGDGTEIPRECNIQGKVNRISSIIYLEIGSGSCKVWVDSLGKIRSKHTSGPNINKQPCDDPHN